MNGLQIDQLARQLHPDARRLLFHRRLPKLDPARFRELALKIADYAPHAFLDTTTSNNSHTRSLIRLLTHLPPGLQLPHLAWYLRPRNLMLPLPRSSGFRDRLFFTDSQAYNSRYIDLIRRQALLDDFAELGHPLLSIPKHHGHPDLETAIHLFAGYQDYLNAARYTLRLHCTGRTGNIVHSKLSRAIYEIRTSLRSPP